MSDGRPQNEAKSREGDASLDPMRPRKRKKRGARGGDVFLVVLILALGALLIAFRPTDLFQLLYNQTMGIILIVIVVEYLILKSMDRTRIYELENRRIREYRRSERALLKRCREVLVEGAELSPDVDEETRKRWNAKAEVLSDDIRDLL